MFGRRDAILTVATLLASPAAIGPVFAHVRPLLAANLGGALGAEEGSGPSAQKTTGPPAAPPPTPQENLVAAEDYTRKLLLLMDTDKSGKISKKEFMSFMEKEFERLDINHDGELDVDELTRLQVRPYVGK